MLVEPSVDNERVTIVTLNRPASRNALSRRLLEQLDAALCRLQAAPDVRVVVLAGHRDFFSAGGVMPTVLLLFA